MSKTTNTLLPKAALLTAALIWGSSFVMMKNAVAVFPTHLLLACRFTIACVILSLVFFRRLKNFTKDYLLKTALTGLCLYLAYTFQTVGIRHTTPGKNAFLTAVYVVIVPFLFWFAGKHKPTAKNIIAAFICLAGVSLISLTPQSSGGGMLLISGQWPGSGLQINIGDMLVAIAAVFWAFHVLIIDRLVHSGCK